MSMPAHEDSHKPVMLAEVLNHLRPVDGGVYVDGTFGAGGYTAAILDAADCIVVAIDRDPSAERRARAFRQKYGDRFIFVRGCFGDVADHLRGAGFEQVDGFVLDIGVSSMQIDEGARGFSFRFDGPLDMRMDNENGASAADLVNTMAEEELANLIYKYGEERKSRRIAKAIVMKRGEEPYKTTAQLADTVRAVVPRSPKDKIDPATRTFQALRIAVNDELGELERALGASAAILKPGARLVVVTFHSLEDVIVKDFLKNAAGQGASVSRYMPLPEEEAAAAFNIITRKAVVAGDAETSENSRARSAKLRAAERTGAAA